MEKALRDLYRIMAGKKNGFLHSLFSCLSIDERELEVEYTRALAETGRTRLKKKGYEKEPLHNKRREKP